MNNIRREIIDDHICVLTFDRPNSTANIFDRPTLLQLDEQLNALGDARGVIFASAKDAIFVAGADLHSIRTMSSSQLEEFIALGQNIFTRIARLPIPTAAAVHGAALGGGYELCLACDYRIASPERSTKLGLPETQLGILPAWGGSTRLPGLIGLPKALDIILAGKTPGAKHALKLGMIDEIAPREYLIRAAGKWLRKGKRSRSVRRSSIANAFVGTLIAGKVRADVRKKTHGHYPAIEKAMEVVIKGAAARNETAALARERAAIAELITLDSTKNLLRLFFLQERARKAATGAVPSPAAPGAKVSRCAAVIGAGVMGAGIAQWLSARGLRVILRDIDAPRVAAGMENIAQLYAAGVKHKALTPIEARLGFDRVSPAPAEVPLRQCDLVIEAAVEKMEIKKKIFQRLDELTREDAVLATNTSALSITELASATKRPQRVVGIHFFNPVQKMQLVEVVAGRESASAAVQQAVRFVQQIGKLPVVVKDSPGFLVNRILLPYMIEAGELFENGADAGEIDEAMLDFGMPMGPLRLIDEVGVDIAEDVASTLAAAFPDRMRVPQILRKMITARLIGKKTGHGFYLHQKNRTEPNPAVQAMRTGTEVLSRSELQRRMVLLMVNEAARCIDEAIVGSPAELDFAMVMGTGFAPFRGGPLRYADHIGTTKIADELAELAKRAGAHFTPSRLLMSMSGKGFYED